jgi:hypothetical protein
MAPIRIGFICAIVIIVIVLLVLNQNGLGFHNNKSGTVIDTINGPLTCPYNSESEKEQYNRTHRPTSIKHLNNIHKQLGDSPFTMEQVFGENGAKSQLITEAEYDHPGPKAWTPSDSVDDYVPEHATIDTEVLRYGNPDVDGYTLCDVNPADDDEYYDPKLMNGKFKSHFNPLVLTTSDEIELIGATPEPVCASTSVCGGKQDINSDPISDIIRGTDNPLPGPFRSKRYCAKK